MVWIRVYLSISIIWISGCAVKRTSDSAPMKAATMMEIYRDNAQHARKDVARFIERQLQEQKTFGYVQPYTPVINQPVVKKIWVPDHKSSDHSDVMIAGHWVYMMIQPSTWFIDGKTSDARVPVIIPVAADNADSVRVDGAGH